MIQKFRPCLRQNASSKLISFDVSSKSKDYHYLSPFKEYGNIPHPCDSSLLCLSVECIWQGSKIFNIENKKPDYYILFGKKSFMTNKGKTPVGMWIGENNITVQPLESREKIYKPAYYWTLDNRCRYYINMLLYEGYKNQNKIIYLYDFGSNIDIDNPSALSHSVLLCEYLNEKYNDELYMKTVIQKFKED